MKRKPNVAPPMATAIAPSSGAVDHVDVAAVGPNDGAEAGRRWREGEPLARQPVVSRSGAGRAIGQVAAGVEPVDDDTGDTGTDAIEPGDDAVNQSGNATAELGDSTGAAVD
jgi:hypothetical protein